MSTETTCYLQLNDRADRQPITLREADTSMLSSEDVTVWEYRDGDDPRVSWSLWTEAAGGICLARRDRFQAWGPGSTYTLPGFGFELLTA